MKPSTTLSLLTLAIGLVCDSSVSAQVILDGRTLFSKNCAACHQLTGKGIDGAFPSLKGNKFVQSNPDPVIATVINGRAGMPSFAASLDDGTLALILTYVRTAWGNTASAVKTEEIQVIRSKSGAAQSMDDDVKPIPSH